MKNIRQVNKTMSLLIAFFAIVVASYGQDKKTVAVAPTLGKSVNEDVKSMVQGALEESIHKSGDFTLVARGESFRQALHEFEFQQQSGAVDDQQLTEFGHAAGANIVCYAEVSKLSETLFRIAYKLIDVESSQILNIGSKSIRNGIEGLLDAADQIAKDLFGKGSFVKKTSGSDTNPGKTDNPDANPGKTSGSDLNPVKTDNPGISSAESDEEKITGNTEKPDERKNGEIRNLDGIEMVFVKGRDSIADFYIGKYELTQAEWKSVMGGNPSEFKGDNLPVETVSWNDVRDFVKKLNAKTGRGYRLPTEAEWEFAARGGIAGSACPDGCAYSGSSDAGNVAWYDGNSEERTHPVGTKQPNELGIYDMSGNVWEWCQDCRDNTKTCYHRVNRGGSWNFGAAGCCVSCRDSDSPGSRYSFLGFRLACGSK